MDQALLAERRLNWPECYNARDLGGLATRDGRLTRRGAIVRADCPSRLTACGWQALMAHGVRTIIDLRGAAEHASAPYEAAVPASLAAELDVIQMPLRPGSAEVNWALSEADTLAEAYALTVDRCQGNVAAVLRAIAHARPGGVAIHCQSGRDRTAIIVALLLDLVGVPPGVIAADYLESQARLWPRWEALVAAAGSEQAAGLSEKPLLDAETMRALLDHLREQYGGVEGYLDAIGLASAERDALVARLLG